MPIKPGTAKIIDLDTTVEAVPSDTAEGPIVWATVLMEYALAGLAPLVTIRVPIPYQESDSELERRAQALRCARQLIDHACRAAGIGPAEPEAGDNGVAEAIESVTPPGLEGIAQELGLAKPTRQPRRERGRKANA
jgi:hypothetical protein